jgi:protocatechuate 3,4-dioxygenase alpha subunit
VSLKQTPSQTVGPFFALGLTAPQYGYPHSAIASGDLADEATDGEQIEISGQVLDGSGVQVTDALIEVWQADAEGRYAHPADGRPSNQNFRGFGRFGTGTKAENGFRFCTVKPGSVDGVQAPHINVIILMRGMLTHAYTRLYFSDEPAANGRDPVLLTVPEERRGTLIARRDDSSPTPHYRFDIHMQGDDETVFFDV